MRDFSKPLGITRTRFTLLSLTYCAGVDGRVDPGYLELPVELEGLDGLRGRIRLVEVLHAKVEAPCCPGS